VGLLAEHAFGHQGFAVGTSRAIQNQADEKTLSANLLDALELHGTQFFHEPGAQFCAVFHQFLFYQDLQGLACYGHAQGVAPEGAAVVAGVKHAHDFIAGQES